MLLLLTVHPLDFSKELGLSSLELLVAESPVVCGFSLQFGINTNGVSILDFSKGVEVQLLQETRNESVSNAETCLAQVGVCDHLQSVSMPYPLTRTKLENFECLKNCGIICFSNLTGSFTTNVSPSSAQQAIEGSQVSIMWYVSERIPKRRTSVRKRHCFRHRYCA